jgi:mono/diheme cytochrome c family protein
MRTGYTREPRPIGSAGYFVAALIVGLALPWPAAGADSPVSLDPDDPPTFSRDIAPLFQRSCQACHQPGGIGPMSLVSYQEVRPWATVIKDRVSRRIMPPWHLDPTVGIQEYKNNIGLSRDEIALIRRWVDEGAPEGDSADLPPPVEWPAWEEWELESTLGPPDLVISSKPIQVPASGGDIWPDHSVAWTEIPRTRHIRAAEIMNTAEARATLHHGHAMLSQPGQSGSLRLSAMGAGKRWDLLSEDTGMKVEPGPGEINWALHYFPVGREMVDVVKVGIWFYPEGEVPEFEAVGERHHLIDQFTPGEPRARDIIIPPHGTLTMNRVYILDEPILIHSFRPHMHLHGIAMSIEVVYPGRDPNASGGVPSNHREVLTSVNNYDHNWQTAYIYEDDARPLLPRGAVLIFHSHFDNTVNNPLSVDPDQWVTFGGRSVDAMSHAHMNVSYLTDEQYESLRARREARKSGGDRVTQGVPGARPEPARTSANH